jgi:hypothetical protein
MTSGNLTGRALLFADALGMCGCGGHAHERAPAASRASASVAPGSTKPCGVGVHVHVDVLPVRRATSKTLVNALVRR